MRAENPYWPRLEVDLSVTSGIIVPKGEVEEVYFERLRSNIRDHATTPELVSAVLVEPGFNHRPLGSTVCGYLLAKTQGYWLVYEPDENQYYCFWGADAANLGAYGVCGNPLYCWWD